MHALNHTADLLLCNGTVENIAWWLVAIVLPLLFLVEVMCIFMWKSSIESILICLRQKKCLSHKLLPKKAKCYAFFFFFFLRKWAMWKREFFFYSVFGLLFLAALQAIFPPFSWQFKKKKKKRILQFLAYMLTLFTEYTAWATFGEMSRSALEGKET